MALRRALSAISAFMLAAAAGSAYAADFEFSVPVDVRNLPPEIVLGRIWCEVTTAEFGGTRVGEGGGLDLPVSGGAIYGTYPISFDARAGVDPSAGTHYYCSLTFVGMVGDIQTTYTPFEWRDDPLAPRIPNTLDQTYVSGPIP